MAGAHTYGGEVHQAGKVNSPAVHAVYNVATVELSGWLG